VVFLNLLWGVCWNSSCFVFPHLSCTHPPTYPLTHHSQIGLCSLWILSLSRPFVFSVFLRAWMGGWVRGLLVKIFLWLHVCEAGRKTVKKDLQQKRWFLFWVVVVVAGCSLGIREVGYCFLKISSVSTGFAILFLRNSLILRDLYRDPLRKKQLIICKNTCCSSKASAAVHGLFSLWDWAVAWAFAILANWDFIFSSFFVRDAVLCFLFSLRLSYWRLVATPCCPLPILITTTTTTHPHNNISISKLNTK
jgi:hypothetical protein